MSFITELNPDKWNVVPRSALHTDAHITAWIAELYAQGIHATEGTIKKHYGYNSNRVKQLRESWLEKMGLPSLAVKHKKHAARIVNTRPRKPDLRTGRIRSSQGPATGNGPSADELDEIDVSKYPLTLAGSIEWFRCAQRRIFSHGHQS